MGSVKLSVLQEWVGSVKSSAGVCRIGQSFCSAGVGMTFQSLFSGPDQIGQNSFSDVWEWIINET